MGYVYTEKNTPAGVLWYDLSTLPNTPTLAILYRSNKDGTSRGQEDYWLLWAEGLRGR